MMIKGRNAMKPNAVAVTVTPRRKVRRPPDMRRARKPKRCEEVGE